MKKEIGKWLLDVAKYVTTAVIISSVFENVRNSLLLYLGGLAAVLVPLSIGLWLIKDETTPIPTSDVRKGEEEKNEEENEIEKKEEK